MNNIKIITEFSPEDRKLLEGLMGSITLLASVLGNAQPQDVQQKIIEEVTGAAPTPTPEAEPVAEETTPKVQPVSFPEFQKVVTQVVAKGAKQKAAAKEIINKYAASVSEVPEDKRAEVMAELAKI